MPGRVILLNGASSAGKATLARAAQDALPEPFLRFSLDLFLYGGAVLPGRRDADGPFAWRAMRPVLFEGYYRCLAALAGAGNDLAVDILLEERAQLDRLVASLGGLDVFLVGVHCPLPELERRERARGDRRIGDAARDHATVHTFTGYDVEVDSTEPPEANAALIAAAWAARARPGVFGRLAAAAAARSVPSPSAR